MSNFMLYNVKLPPKPVARLRAYCARVGISQGLLLQRFIETLPTPRGVQSRKVTVDVTPLPLKDKPKSKAAPKKARTSKGKTPVVKAKRKYTRKPKETAPAGTPIEEFSTRELVRAQEAALSTINDAPVLTDADLAQLDNLGDPPAGAQILEEEVYAAPEDEVINADVNVVERTPAPGTGSVGAPPEEMEDTLQSARDPLAAA